MKRPTGRALARALPALAELLTQALVLLNDADEANHCGHPVTFELQRQTREVLAEAIDELAARVIAGVPRKQVLKRAPTPLERRQGSDHNRTIGSADHG